MDLNKKKKVIKRRECLDMYNHYYLQKVKMPKMHTKQALGIQACFHFPKVYEEVKRKWVKAISRDFILNNNNVLALNILKMSQLPMLTKYHLKMDRLWNTQENNQNWLMMHFQRFSQTYSISVES